MTVMTRPKTDPPRESGRCRLGPLRGVTGGRLRTVRVNDMYLDVRGRPRKSSATVSPGRHCPSCEDAAQAPDEEEHAGASENPYPLGHLPHPVKEVDYPRLERILRAHDT